MTDPTTRLRTAESAYTTASRQLVDAVRDNVIALTLETFPTASSLTVLGTFGDSGFTVRARRVTDADGVFLAGYDADDMSTSEEWDDFTDEVDQLLDQLGEQNEDDWTGVNEIDLRGAGPLVPTIPADPPKRHFVITIDTDFPGADEAIRQAGEKLACQIDWGNDNTTSIEVVEHNEGELDRYIAGWEMEPGDDVE